MKKNILAFIFIFIFINPCFAEQDNYYCKNSANFSVDSDGNVDKHTPHDIILKKQGKNIKVKWNFHIYLFKHIKYVFHNPHFDNFYLYTGDDNLLRTFILFENPESNIYKATLSIAGIDFSRLNHYTCSKTNL